MVWFSEENNLPALLLKSLTPIASINSEHGIVSIFNHDILGKVLIINGELQTVQLWAPIYHETLVHLPIAFLPKIKSALIIGGGDLYAAKELLKYPSIEKVTLVDHNPIVIDLVSKYFDHAKAVASDNRLEIIYEDGLNYLSRTLDYFDLIINDAIDFEMQKSEDLDLFALFENRLGNSGVCVDIAYRSIWESSYIKIITSEIRKRRYSKFGLIGIPEYPGFYHLLVLWSKSNQLDNECTINEYQKKYQFADYQFDYFMPQSLASYLHIPPYIKQKIMQ